MFDQPWVYRLGQKLLYRSGAQAAYVSEYIQPKAGLRVLDVGCGPGIFLDYLPGTQYSGIDPNPRYIEGARARFGEKGEFRCGLLRPGGDWNNEKFDVILANGVLHHISDTDARQLLALCSSMLKPGGRFVSRDGCFAPGQSWPARFFLERDRGGFVRDESGYQKLLQPHFKAIRAEIRDDLLRVPYPLYIFVGEAPR
ncbi:MAG: class I SAM-dependent methyltransferase [Bdellovibrionota bacterium]